VWFPDHDHDHDLCRRAALDAAEAECLRRGLRLTPIRRRVLELVWQGHSAVGAYALLQVLAAEGWPAAPPTVYRALDFLLDHGLIHRVDSKNAFIGCPSPGHECAGVVVLCRICGTAAEIADDGVDRALADLLDRLGMRPDGRRSVEVEGLCPACARAPETVR
jgi:Fur family zinc uptake transcriptional regulator